MRQETSGNNDDNESLNPHLPVREPDQFNVVRRVYHQDALNEDAGYTGSPSGNLKSRYKKLLVRKLGYGDCLLRSLPIIDWLPKYNVKKNLVGDLVAGATGAIIHIPQGMACALLAEVPPIVGLYMAFFPVLLYVVFGTSPFTSMGTFAVACLMTGKVVTQITTVNHDNHTLVLPLNATQLNRLVLEPAILPPELVSGGHYAPLEVAAVVCFTVGCFQLGMWALRLGLVSSLLSEPLVSGFTCAASFHVLASQVKELFGIAIPKYSGNYKVIITLIEICKSIVNVNWAAFIISIITFIIIALNNTFVKPWMAKCSRVPLPIELLAIVTGTLIGRYAKLTETYSVKVVGNIPTGLPKPKLPPFKLIPRVTPDAFIITMVTYSISMSMALIFADKEKAEIDSNQELLAMGASNVFASFFSCLPFCASLSRSYIQYNAGSKTGLTSVTSALLILCVLLWVGPFFEALPLSVLATIVVVSLSSMFAKVTDVARFAKLSHLDAMVWVITFFTTLIINIDIGLVVGLLASVGSLFCRAQKPYTCLLGRVHNTDLYLDIKRYRATEEIPGLKIFHYCGGVNFASKNLFRETLFRKTGYMRRVDEPGPVLAPDEDNLSRTTYKWDPTIAKKVQCIIIDASALSHVDAPGIKSIVATHRELVAADILVLLAGANAPVLEMVEKYNNLETDKFDIPAFPTVHDADFQMATAKKEDKDITISSS